MSACAPDTITNPDERRLYRDLSRVFEDYCGTNHARYREREEGFVKVGQVALDTIRSRWEQAHAG